MKISEKIQILRKKKGLSQENLANMLGLSRQTVFKWEAGESTPDIDNIKKLAEIFGVSFDLLLNFIFCFEISLEFEEELSKILCFDFSRKAF